MAQNNRNTGRGFASMDPDRQREIASEGGRASRQNGRTDEGDHEEPAEGGHLGGLAAHHHSSAAFHHDTAGHHHREAARHHATGSPVEAAHHRSAAEMHSERAQGHARSARQNARGFAAMDPDEQREIAATGGRSSHGGGLRGTPSRGYDDERIEDGDADRDERRGAARERDDDADRNGRSDRGASARGGSREQHAEAGRQSHRN